MRKTVVLFLSALCAFAGWKETAKEMSLLDQVEKSLGRAGENRAVLESVLESARPEIMPGAVFMIAYSPAVNLASFDRDSLIEEIEAAYLARDRFPWGREIGEDLFLHYVLPNQVSQEPLAYYRKYLIEQLAPILDTVRTASEAALAINRWCGERVTFKQTQRQDQGVFHTLSSGYGRCEEMMIVFVSALRSAGIPARQAWTPYWATSDNNHAWTELYADGAWHYAGSCEPAPSLDNAWFSNTARRAAVILSAAFGVPPKEGDILYRERENYALINSFPNYAVDPAVVEVTTNAESTDVYLAVFNFGALRPILSQNSGIDNEKVFFHIGRGDYVLFAGSDSTFAWTQIHTEFGETTAVALEPRQGGSMEANSFWLRYPVQD